MVKLLTYIDCHLEDYTIEACRIFKEYSACKSIKELIDKLSMFDGLVQPTADEVISTIIDLGNCWDGWKCLVCNDLEFCSISKEILSKLNEW